MSTTTAPATGYGYASDEQKVSNLVFGLNPGAKMTRFQWIPNGGAGGAEQEALDIIFNINGTEKSYRMFPVTQAFIKGSTTGEVTKDPNSAEFKQAIQDFNSVMIHILHAYRGDDYIKPKLMVPIESFKDYTRVCHSILPENFAEIPVDIFLQYQWQPSSGNDRTYLEIPKNQKNGAWIKAAVPGNWKEKRLEQFTDRDNVALWYENDAAEVHPITKSGYFLSRNNAKQQVFGNGVSQAATQAAATATQTDGAIKKSAW